MPIKPMFSIFCDIIYTGLHLLKDCVEIDMCPNLLGVCSFDGLDFESEAL